MKKIVFNTINFLLFSLQILNAEKNDTFRQVNNSIYAETYYTLKLSSCSDFIYTDKIFKEILIDLSKKYGLNIAFENSCIPLNKPLSFNFRNIDLKTFFKILIKSAGLNYRLIIDEYWSGLLIYDHKTLS